MSNLAVEGRTLLPKRLVWILALLVLTACSPSDRRDTPSRPVENSAGQWKKLAPALSSRTEVTAAALANEIYVAGGFAEDQSTVSSVEIYDVATDRFRAGPDLPLAVNHAMSASDKDVIYIMGGYLTGLSRPTDRAFALKGGKWEEMPAMPEPRAAAGAAAVGGRIYVAGGIGPEGLADSTLVFDPATNTWDSLPGLSTPREHLGVAGFENRLYVVGGRAPSNLAAAEAFDPVENKWSSLPDMPTARGGLAAAATSNGFIVAPGGEESAGTFKEVEAFDTKRNRWTRLPNLPTARHGLGVAAIGTTVYVISGGPQPGFAFSNANEALDLSRL